MVQNSKNPSPTWNMNMKHDTLQTMYMTLLFCMSYILLCWIVSSFAIIVVNYSTTVLWLLWWRNVPVCGTNEGTSDSDSLKKTENTAKTLKPPGVIIKTQVFSGNIVIGCDLHMCMNVGKHPRILLTTTPHTFACTHKSNYGVFRRNCPL